MLAYATPTPHDREPEQSEGGGSVWLPNNENAGPKAGVKGNYGRDAEI